MTWPRGQMRYNLATLAELRVFEPLPYTLDLDGESRSVRAMLVAVGNGPSFGGGLRITEGAVLDDGLLDVVFFHPITKRDLLRTYPKLFKGTHTTHPAYEHHRVREVTVAAPGHRGLRRRRAARPAADHRARAAAGALEGAGATMSPTNGGRSHVTSPSERYAKFRSEQSAPVLADFRLLYDFPLDDFQVRACEAVEGGDGVLVAAPTGSGKTIVGEFAVHLALHQGRKCFYTTPIKALSNQKYADLVRRYGADKVGLLTGDNTVNGEAPVVVMTTEVLRNMLYAGSQTLSGLGYVVMDEVHYLADRMRGAVWEEVIIHLPESVAVVSLSATVSNAEEFGEWLATVRGSTTTIVEETSPRAALPARHGGPAPVRPVRERHRLRGAGQPGQPRPGAGGPGRLARPADGAPARAALGPAPEPRRPAAAPPLAPVPVRRRRPARPRRPAPGDLLHLQPGRVRRRGPAVPRRRSAADHGRRARRDLRVRRGAVRPHPRRGPARPGLPRLPRRPRPAGSPPTTPGCSRRSRSASRSCSRPDGAAWCSRPRPWPWASTCRRGPW